MAVDATAAIANKGPTFGASAHAGAAGNRSPRARRRTGRIGGISRGCDPLEGQAIRNRDDQSPFASYQILGGADHRPGAWRLRGALLQN